MQVIADRYATMADKIRALAAAGHSRADIARALGRSYQQVRNVLQQDEVRARARAQLVQSGVEENSAAYDTGMDDVLRAKYPPTIRLASTRTAAWFCPGR